MTKNQASGGESVKSPRSHERRHSIADTAPARPDLGRAAPDPLRLSGSAITDTPSPAYPMTCVHALTHSWNATQSLWPFPHWANGVFQNFSVWKYASGALA